MLLHSFSYRSYSAVNVGLGSLRAARHGLARQAVRNDIEDNGIKGHAQVRAGDFKIAEPVPGSADAPIDDAVGFGINGRLSYGFGEFGGEGFEKPASARARVTVR